MTPDMRHPRPQVRRSGWTDLSGEWSFAYDDADIGIAARWFEGDAPFGRTIRVPFPPESPASGIGDTGLHPVLWYRRVISVAADDRPARLMLHFGAVDYRADVWVNGRLAATHEGGQTSFAADIAPLLVPGADQVVTVRAFDDPADIGQPRGKQYWEVEPALIWYHRMSGIWQIVWLEALGPVAIADLGWTPDLDSFSIGLSVRLNRAPPPGSRLRVRLFAGKAGDLLVDDSYAIEAIELARDIGLEANLAGRRKRNLLWTPRTPNLVDATLELIGPDGAVLDSVDSHFGMQSVEVRDGRFHLNNNPVFMRLVLAQNYWPASHLAAPDDDALRREVEMARALGFNGLRIHQKIEDPRILHWCDRLGLMVWAEAANAYRFDASAAERLIRDWMEAVRRDRGHPCVVAWCR